MKSASITIEEGSTDTRKEPILTGLTDDSLDNIWPDHTRRAVRQTEQTEELRGAWGNRKQELNQDTFRFRSIVILWLWGI